MVLARKCFLNYQNLILKNTTIFNHEIINFKNTNLILQFTHSQTNNGKFRQMHNYTEIVVQKQYNNIATIKDAKSILKGVKRVVVGTWVRIIKV